MIFVTFGNVPISFFRLARKVDEIARRSEEEFIVQCGHTDFHFAHAKARKFLSNGEMVELIDRASVVVTHGGYGTISECMKQGKRVVAVPRTKEEHNHSQEELVRALEQEGYVLGVYDINDLEKKLLEARSFVPKQTVKTDVSGLINSFVSNHILLKK